MGMTSAPHSRGNPLDVIVVGGGIGGLSVADALASAGHQVRVLEQSPAFGEVGAGLQLGPNATRILREWGLLDEVIAAGVLPRRLVLKDALDGSELTHLDLGRDFLSRYEAPTSSSTAVTCLTSSTVPASALASIWSPTRRSSG